MVDGHRFESVRDAAADYVGQCGHAALIRHVGDLHDRHVVEIFRNHVRGCAGAGRRERVLARIRFKQRDEFLRVLRRERRRGDEQKRRHADIGDRRELALRVVSRLLQKRIDRHRPARRCEQRVAVGRRLRRDVGSYHAAGARPVVDHDLLAEHVGHFLRHHAADQIGRLARRPRHYHAQRAVGIILLRARGARDRQHGRE